MGREMHKRMRRLTQVLRKQAQRQRAERTKVRREQAWRGFELLEPRMLLSASMPSSDLGDMVSPQVVVSPPSPLPNSSNQVLWTEGFENGWGDWTTDAGVWQVGAPSSGPNAAFAGSSVAGTNLAGNYPDNTDSRLISPSQTLATISGAERLELRFREWYKYRNDSSGGDRGTVQISTWNGSSWGSWQDLGVTAPDSTARGWETISLDVSNFAGQQVRFGFFHQADSSLADSGWYIDQLGIASTNRSPVITGLNDAPDHVLPGGLLTLTATGVSDPDNNLRDVRFYRESNGQLGLQTESDTYLGYDGSSSGGWMLAFAAPSAIGTYTYYASPTDTNNFAGNVVATTNLVDTPPVVATLSGSPNPVTLGQSLTLAALGVSDADIGDNVVTVEFYRDENGNGILDPGIDVLLGTDNSANGGWIWTGTTADFTVGSNRFFARAQDTLGVWSMPASTMIQIDSADNQPPTISSLVASPSPVAIPDTLTLTANGVNDPDGTVVSVEFYRDSNSNGALDLGVDQLLGKDTSGVGGWTWTGSTAGFDMGVNRYFARAQDDDGAWSTVVTTTGTVNPVAGDFQIVMAPNIMGPAGGSVSLPMSYDVSNADATLTGLGIRIHFDSSKLDWTGFANLRAGLVGQSSSPQADVANFDGDATTDQFVSLTWGDFGGNWPNAALPTDLGSVLFDVADGLNQGDTTMLHYTAIDTAVGYALQAASSTFTVADVFNLDVDGNGQYQYLKDGVLVMRYMAGFRGADLIANAIGSGATRVTAEAIGDFLEQAGNALDIDGNGQVQYLKDGVLAMRYMAGFRGADLIANAIGTGATRSTAGAIESYLQSLTPTAGQLPNVASLHVQDYATAPRLQAMTAQAAGDTSQTVAPLQPNVAVAANQTVSSPIMYQASDGNGNLTGLGLRVHYDSANLTYNGVANVLPAGLVGQSSQPVADTADFDNDPATDRFVQLLWADLASNWPGQTAPIKLFDVDFAPTPALQAGLSTHVRFSSIDTAQGYDFASTPLSVSLATATGTPRLSIVAIDDHASESGDTGMFRISRDHVSHEPLGVSLLASGSAKYRADYDLIDVATGLPVNGKKMTIPAGAASLNVMVVPKDDTRVEPNEQVSLQLRPGKTYEIDSTADVASVLIEDNEPIVSVAAIAESREGESSGGIFRFSRDVAGPDALTVKVKLGGTAKLKSDYLMIDVDSGQPIKGTNVLIPAGQMHADVMVHAVDDAVTDPDESIVLDIIGGKTFNVAQGASSASMLIRDNEPVVSVVTAQNASEADPRGKGLGRFVIERTGDRDQAITVGYTVTGSATPGVDYTPLSGVAIIPAGQSSVVVEVVATPDSDTEINDLIVVSLIQNENFQISSSDYSASMTVTDDPSTVDFMALTRTTTGSSTVEYDVIVGSRVVGTMYGTIDGSPASGWTWEFYPDEIDEDYSLGSQILEWTQSSAGVRLDSYGTDSGLISLDLYASGLIVSPPVLSGKWNDTGTFYGDIASVGYIEGQVTSEMSVGKPTSIKSQFGTYLTTPVTLKLTWDGIGEIDGMDRNGNFVTYNIAFKEVDTITMFAAHGVGVVRFDFTQAGSAKVQGLGGGSAKASWSLIRR